MIYINVAIRPASLIALDADTLATISSRFRRRSRPTRAATDLSLVFFSHITVVRQARFQENVRSRLSLGRPRCPHNRRICQPLSATVAPGLTLNLLTLFLTTCFLSHISFLFFQDPCGTRGIVAEERAADVARSRRRKYSLTMEAGTCRRFA